MRLPLLTAAVVAVLLVCPACKKEELPPAPAQLINGTRDRLNPFRLAISTDPQFPKASGPILLKVHAIDATGQPADGLTVKAEVTMNGGARGASLTLDSRGSGDYEGQFSVESPGMWDVDLTASQEDKVKRQRITLDVGN